MEQELNILLSGHIHLGWLWAESSEEEADDALDDALISQIWEFRQNFSDHFSPSLKIRRGFSSCVSFVPGGLGQYEGEGRQRGLHLLRTYCVSGTVLWFTNYHLSFKSALEAGVLNHILLMKNWFGGLSSFSQIREEVAEWASEEDRPVSRAYVHQDICFCLPKPLESPLLSSIVTIAHTQREENKIFKKQLSPSKGGDKSFISPT